MEDEVHLEKPSKGDYLNLIIFAKAPIKGFVKTRLKKDANLSEDEVLKLYKAFLKDTILMADKTSSDKVYLSYYPKDEKDAMEELVKDFEGGKKLFFLPQKGRDFDERFTNAVGDVKGNAVVIGGDSPNIQPKSIEKAFDSLGSEGGMVLGPTSEGGAYLVGVSKSLDFTGVFTTGVEMNNLVSLAKENDMPLLLLDELTDLDISSDLITFICNIEAMEYAARFSDYFVPENTIRAVREIGLSIVDSRGGERGRRLVKKSNCK